MITEVQITCIVLMALMTFILSFSLPHFTIDGKVHDNARKLLVGGTALITIHFAIQYALHKPVLTSTETRTLVNMLFGTPTSFFVNYSLLYLQRQGKILKWEWWFCPAIYAVILGIVGYTALVPGLTEESMHIANIWMSILYAVTLLFANVLQLREYFLIKKKIKFYGDYTLQPLMKWTKWSMFLLAVVGVGLPVMTFNQSTILRSIYGVYTISIAFFYVFSFIGYSLNCYNKIKVYKGGYKKKELTEKTETEKLELCREKKLEVERIVNTFIESRYYLKQGITIQDVAKEMGISRQTLKTYLQENKQLTFNNWLIDLRIEEAKRLLTEHKEWSNETVAQASGFNNRTYFQTQFCERVGTTPAKWSKLVTEK